MNPLLVSLAAITLLCAACVWEPRRSRTAVVWVGFLAGGWLAILVPVYWVVGLL